MSNNQNSNLICPQCKTDLQPQKNTFFCQPCNLEYPAPNYIPWLTSNPLESMAEWRNQLKTLIQSLEYDANEIKGDLQDQGLLESTKKRLRKMQQAKAEQRKFIAELLAPLEVKETGSFQLSAALNAKLAKTQNLLSYYQNISRDWSWGDAENTASLQCIKDVLPEKLNLGNLLTIGGGACRLPYDVHNELSPQHSTIVDINPLLMFSAKQIIKGKTLKLYEFPIAPKDLDSSAVLRKCKAPSKIESNLDFYFADALNLPFKQQSFNTVLTPWLIDILPEDPKKFFIRINQLLEDGGRWINFGSLVFTHKNPSSSYSLEEIREIIADSGFEIEQEIQRTIPYLQSPANNHGRVEGVFCFSAKKIKHIEESVTAYKNLPEWVIDSSLPIPTLPMLEQQKTIYSIYLDVVKEINGQKSITDIAKSFGAMHGLEEDEAVNSITNYLTRLLQDPTL